MGYDIMGLGGSVTVCRGLLDLRVGRALASMFVLPLWVFGRSGWVGLVCFRRGVQGRGGSGNKSLCVCGSAGVGGSNFY